jgi:uridine phosphorylase
MQERITPQMTIDYTVARNNITVEEIGVAPIVVVSWGYDVIQSMVDSIGAELAQHWIYGERRPLYTGQIQGQRVSLAHLPVGAPGTVMLMEEMIACGARIFLGLGWAGSLQPFAPVGSLLIPTTCIREEGTSSHYLEDETIVTADDRLVQLLKGACQAEGLEPHVGPQWTIDAPYRELISKIEAYARQGVQGVDMETSAMYALGQYRHVSVANLLVVSDELWQAWRPAFGTPELREATQQAQRVIARCLSSDLLAQLVNEDSAA